MCTYTLGIEHAGTVKRGKDRDKETNQGQPETRALLEKVEKEMKKTRGTSHLEKFEARAQSPRRTQQRLYSFVVC